MIRNDAVWLTRHRPAIRIGAHTGRVAAFDSSTGICLVEWDDGVRETWRLDEFTDDKIIEIERAVDDIVEGYSVPHVRLLNAMALVVMGLMIAALVLAWMGGLGA